MVDGRPGVPPAHDAPSPRAVPGVAKPDALAWADGKLARRVGTFFGSLDSEDPVCVTCRLNTHPDKVLRRIGIIEGHATPKFSSGALVYSAAKRSWICANSREPVTPWGLTNREDKTPKGIIHVTGEATWLEAHTDGKRTVDTVIKERIERETRRRDDETKAQLPEVLTPYEEARLVEQYIVHSIPQCARKTETCIVTNGVGRLAAHIGSGVQALQDEGVSGGLPVSEVRQGHILAVGVSRTSSGLCSQLTHHVVVENDTSCAAEKKVVKPSDPEVVRAGGAGGRPNQEVEFGQHLTQSSPLHRQGDGLETEGSESEVYSAGLVDDGNPDHDVCFDGQRFALIDVDDVNPEHHRTLIPFQDFSPHRRRKARVNYPECSEFRCRYTEETPHPYFQHSDHTPQEELLKKDLIKLTFSGGGGALKRSCACGRQLAPLEIAKCVCGRFDYEHVSWQHKRRKLALLKRQGLFKSTVLMEHLAFYTPGVPLAVTRRDLAEYTHRLLLVLSKGHTTKSISKNIKDRGQTAPPRQRIPVVTVLVGGGAYEKFNIAKSVSRRWPLIVVEGSGGYADTLCGIMNKVEAIVLNTIVKEMVEAAAANAEGDSDASDEAPKPSGEKGKGEGGPPQKRQCMVGLDDFQKYLSSIDSLTADIVINGKIDIVRKGTTPQEMIRKVENALMGDEVLTSAWRLYAQWLDNADNQQSWYFFYEIMIIALSILLTALSVLHTFLELLWSRGDHEAPTMLPNEHNFLLYLWMLLQWAVILLPILLTVMRAVSRMQLPGPKWVALKASAERLLSEIYMYRTSTNHYSPDSLSKHIRSHDPPLYSTKEELLQQRAVELSDSLIFCEVANVTLRPYEGPLPPSSIRAAGDGGYAPLTPDVYQKVRLDHNINHIEQRAKAQSAHLGRTSILAMVLNAVGTFLAATATYGRGDIAAWTVLTVCIATNLSKWIDDKRMDLALKRMNTAVFKLNKVSLWWTGQAPSAYKQENRDILVEETEAHILDLELMWGSIISRADTSPPPKKEDPTNAQKGTKTKESALLVGARHGIDFDMLTQDNLLEAFDNGKKNGQQKEGVTSAAAALLSALSKPSSGAAGAQAAPAKEDPSTEDPDTETGDDAAPTDATADGPVKKRPEATSQLATAQKQAAEALRCKEDPLTGLMTRKGDLLGRDLREALVSSTVRAELIQELRWLLKNRRNVVKVRFLQNMQKFPEVIRCVSQYNTRQLVEILKHITIWHLFENLPLWRDIEAETADPQSDARTSNPPSPEGTSPSYWREVVVSELYLAVTCASFGTVYPSKPARLVNLVRNPYLRAYLRNIDEQRVVDIFHIASAWLQKPHLEETDPNAYYRCCRMFNNCILRIADLDCDTFLESKQLRVSLWKSIEDILQLVDSKKWRKLERESLLKYLPHTVSVRIQYQTALQIGRYLEKIVSGTPASRAFSASHQKYDRLLRLSQREGQDPRRIFHPTEGDRELRERIVLVSMELNQVDINKSHKGQLRRKISLTGVASDALFELLFHDMDDAGMRFFLSVLQTQLNNTFSLKVLDMQGDVDALDHRPANLDAHAATLVGGAIEFKGETITSLSKAEIIQRYGKRSLAPVLEEFSQVQLQGLISDILSVSCKLYPLFVFEQLCAASPELLKVQAVREVVWAWDPGFITLLVDGLAAVDIQAVHESGDSESDDDTPTPPVPPLLPTAQPQSPAPDRKEPVSSFARRLLGAIDYDEVRGEVTQMLAARRKGHIGGGTTVGLRRKHESAFIRIFVQCVQDESGSAILAELLEAACISLLTDPAFAVCMRCHDESSGATLPRPKKKRSTSKRRRGEGGMRSSLPPPQPGRSGGSSSSSTQATPRSATPPPPLGDVLTSPAKTDIRNLLISSPPAEREELLVLLSRFACGPHLYAQPGGVHTVDSLDAAELLARIAPPPPPPPPPDTDASGQPPPTGETRPSGVYSKLVDVSKWGPKALHHVLVTCANSLAFGAPVMVFHAVAKRLQTVDLRDIVCGMADRRLFTLFLADMLQSGVVSAYDTIAVPSHGRSSYSLAQTWNGDPPPPSCDEPENAWKSRFLREGMRRANGMYRSVIDSLRQLNEGQLLLMVQHANALFHSEAVSKFFWEYVKSARGGDGTTGVRDDEWVAWLTWYTTVHELRARVGASQSVAEVSSLMCGFRSAELMKKPPQALANLFNELNLTPEQQVPLSRYSPDELEARVFAYLRPESYGRPIPRHVGVEACQKIRTEWWKKFRADNDRGPELNTARSVDL